MQQQRGSLSFSDISLEESLNPLDVEFIQLNFDLEEIEGRYQDQWMRTLEQMFIIGITVLTMVSVVGLFWIENT